MIQPILTTNNLSFSGLYSGKKHILPEYEKIAQPIKDKVVLSLNEKIIQPLKETASQQFTKENVKEKGKEILQTMKKIGAKIKDSLKDDEPPTLTEEELLKREKEEFKADLIGLLALLTIELLVFVAPVVFIIAKLKSLCK